MPTRCERHGCWIQGRAGIRKGGVCCGRCPGLAGCPPHLHHVEGGGREPDFQVAATVGGTPRLLPRHVDLCGANRHMGRRRVRRGQGPSSTGTTVEAWVGWLRLVYGCALEKPTADNSVHPHGHGELDGKGGARGDAKDELGLAHHVEGVHPVSDQVAGRGVVICGRERAGRVAGRRAGGELWAELWARGRHCELAGKLWGHCRMRRHSGGGRARRPGRSLEPGPPELEKQRKRYRRSRDMSASTA